MKLSWFVGIYRLLQAAMITSPPGGRGVITTLLATATTVAIGRSSVSTGGSVGGATTAIVVICATVWVRVVVRAVTRYPISLDAQSPVRLL